LGLVLAVLAWGQASAVAELVEVSVVLELVPVLAVLAWGQASAGLGLVQELAGLELVQGWVRVLAVEPEWAVPGCCSRCSLHS
jgi:hypothetical protein